MEQKQRGNSKFKKRHIASVTRGKLKKLLTRSFHVINGAQLVIVFFAHTNEHQVYRVLSTIAFSIRNSSHFSSPLWIVSLVSFDVDSHTFSSVCEIVRFACVNRFHCYAFRILFFSFSVFFVIACNISTACGQCGMAHIFIPNATNVNW